MKTWEPWTNCQEASINSKKQDITPKRERVFSEWRLFSKMNFTTYHSSCYRIETRTSKNSDELRAIEKAYVVVTYSV